MTDQETTKHIAQESEGATASLTASEGSHAVLTESAASPAEQKQEIATETATKTDTATADTETAGTETGSTLDNNDHASTGEALLAAIEAVVPSAPPSAPMDISVTLAATEPAPEAVNPVETADPVETANPTEAASPEETATSELPDSEAVVAVEEKPRIPFADLNLDPRLQKGIDEQGFSHCTPIQSESLPHTLAKLDVIGKAQTGTGKTAAFLITIIQNLLTEPEQQERYNGEPRALILAPTRELALQIEKDARPLLKNTPLNMVSIVGGMDYKKQQKRLQEEIIDIVVGTPGRLIDFVRGKDLFLSETEIVVIDEADRMLDMGFIPDVKRLVRETPYKTYRQTLLFSATFTPDIMNLSENWTREPVRIEIEPDSVANASVDQKIYIVMAEQKLNVLYNLITQQKLDRVMVFVNRRDETRDLTTKLKALGLRVAMLSGEIPQHKRLRTLENFRNGRLRVMVATDVAGRGIHIEGISHVVNYTLPEDPEDYVHRIGRTGRAGATGTSVSFACEEDAFLIPAIEKLLGGNVICTHPEPELLAELPELIAE